MSDKANYNFFTGDNPTLRKQWFYNTNYAIGFTTNTAMDLSAATNWCFGKLCVGDSNFLFSNCGTNHDASNGIIDYTFTVTNFSVTNLGFITNETSKNIVLEFHSVWTTDSNFLTLGQEIVEIKRRI